MTTVKLTAIGNSVGVIFPKEILAKLRVDKGDLLYISEVPEGMIIRSYDDKFARHMAAAEQIMRENRDALRRLAE